MDIDAYASGICYANFLCLQGKNAVFASSATLNGSIPKFILDLGFKVERDYEPSEGDQFIIVDLSNPGYVDSMVDQDKIIEVIDHHTGFESYWAGKCKSQIEFIGSVATIIYERYEKANLLGGLTPELCKLLLCAILDNTLNLKSDITTKRDMVAYKKLQKLAGLNKVYDEQYFLSCQEEINKDVIGSIVRDIKVVDEKMLPTNFGQLTTYDKAAIINKIKEISLYFQSLGQSWMLNIICLKDGKSYIVAGDDKTKENLQELFNLQFVSGVLTLPKFKLRKEIIKLAQEH